MPDFDITTACHEFLERSMKRVERLARSELWRKAPKQIKAKAGEETALRDAWRQAFGSKDFFIIFADHKRLDLQKTGPWIDARCAPVAKSSGTVIAELFDSEGKLFWRSNNASHTLQGKRFDNGTEPSPTGIVATLGFTPGTAIGNVETRMP